MAAVAVPGVWCDGRGTGSVDVPELWFQQDREYQWLTTTRTRAATSPGTAGTVVRRGRLRTRRTCALCVGSRMFPRTPSEICDMEGHLPGRENEKGVLVCPRCGAEL